MKMKAKKTVRELLDRLPDDCSLEDILYHLYVVQAIEAGLADVEAGRTISHPPRYGSIWRRCPRIRRDCRCPR